MRHFYSFLHNRGEYVLKKDGTDRARLNAFAHRLTGAPPAEKMALSKELLLDFMRDKLGVDTTDVDEDTCLFSSGIIDSAGMVELIVVVESAGNVKFSPDEITLDHLDSIGRILSFVADKHEP